MTREELINEYLKEHRHDVLLNPYAGLLDFSKYLDEHSELPEGLEEAAEEYTEAASLTPGNEWLSGDIIDAFKAGAEWQRKKDQQLIELAEDHAMLAGMNKMKEEMMEKAVEGVVQDDGRFINFGDGRYIDLDPTMENKPVFELTDGEKVRVIVIKEEK